MRDSFRWLEDGESNETREWLAAQQAYARAILNSNPGRSRIAARLEQAMSCGLLGITVPRGRYRFFIRRRGETNQAVLYVSEEGAERALVDPNPMSADGTTALDWYYPSHEGELVAFGLSEAGDENSTLMIVETATGRVLPDRIPRCRLAAVAFEAGSRAILYSCYPAPGEVPPGDEYYYRHVFRHVLGQDATLDRRVFGEGRAKTHLATLISTSRNGRWAVLTESQGWEVSELFLRAPDGRFEPFFCGHEKNACAWFAGDRLLVGTSFGAPNNQLVEVDPQRPAPAHWRELVGESEHVMLEGAATQDRLLIHHLVSASSRVSIHHPDGRFERYLDLPPMSTVTGIGASAALPHAYLTVETFTRPPFALEVDPHTGATREIQRLEPPTGFDPDRYPTRQVRYRSKDGTVVNMFLVGRRQGPGPTVLTGYGGFNLSRTPLWTPTVIPFLEAGGLYAVANLRGGSEYGEAWHRAGMLGSKQNVFDDFIGAAEWLIREGYAQAGRLGILGGSNGGLLVGAALTQRPELFGAVVCRVPLLDMVRYERFKMAQLWASEYGSAADPEAFRWLLAYSPYHRVVDGVRYPPILIATGEGDSRVDPMHARKMTARLQAANPDGLVLLRVESRAGHGQGKPVAKLVPEEADVWSFLLTHCG